MGLKQVILVLQKIALHLHSRDMQSHRAAALGVKAQKRGTSRKEPSSTDPVQEQAEKRYLMFWLLSPLIVHMHERSLHLIETLNLHVMTAVWRHHCACFRGRFCVLTPM